MRLRSNFAVAVLLLRYNGPARSCLGFTAVRSRHPFVSRQRSQFTSLSTSQLLEFQEPTTGVTVQLVGSMHFNPVSIHLTKKTIQTLAEKDRLGSVVLEMCDVNWNATKDVSPILQYFIQSEFDAAHDLALHWQRPIILGDQRINVTCSRLKAGAIDSVLDLIKPWSGGWKRLYRNITEAWREAVPLGGNYLGTSAFLDPKLWLASPVTFVKYLLTFGAKSSLVWLLILALLLLMPSRVHAAHAHAGIRAVNPTVVDWVKWLLENLLTSVLLARLLLKELLVERNQVLARNILEQCRLQQVIPPPPSASPLFSRRSTIPHDPAVVDTGTTVYAPLSVRPIAEGQEKVVVAVMGMAHCNGVMKLLTEQRVV